MTARKYKDLVAAFNALGKRLDSQKKSLCTLTFIEVSQMAGEPLPPSAYKHRPWWSNNKYNNNSNRPWERAGFVTRHVDFDAQTVTFRRVPMPTPPAPSQTPVISILKRLQRQSDSPNASPTQDGLSDVTHSFLHAPTSGHHPLRGALKGTLRIVAGTDLTAPADPEWGNTP